jgi:hypothetical protein
MDRRPMPSFYAASLPHDMLTACHLFVAGLPLCCRPTSSVIIIIVIIFILDLNIIVIHPLSLRRTYIPLFMYL